MGMRTKPLGGQGTLSRYWELKMAPWELTGKVRREERDHGVRKLPVPGAGWALQKPREYSRGGMGAGPDGGREKNAHGEKTHRT